MLSGQVGGVLLDIHHGGIKRLKTQATKKGAKEKAISKQKPGFFSRTLKGMHFQVQHTQQSPHRFTRGTP